MSLFWALVGLLLGVPLSLALPRVWPLFAGDGDFVVFAGAAGGGAALTLLVLRFVQAPTTFPPLADAAPEVPDDAA
jgi:hypothetical protein